MRAQGAYNRRIRTVFVLFLACLAQLCLSGAASGLKADESVARDAHLSGDAQRTRFVTVLSKKAKFAVRTLSDPYRVIIDMSDVKLDLPPGSGTEGRGLVTGYRYGRVEPHGVRIILDVKAPVIIDKAGISVPGEGRPPRLTLELVRTDRDTFMARQQARVQALAERKAKARKKDSPPLASPRRRLRNDKLMIVIDPGHGGIDPGAVSRSGLEEKDVVLAFSEVLEHTLKKSGRYEVALTRREDSYIPLRERVAFARRKGAHLFISVHADSLPRRHANKVSGATVYTLSEQASDEEARTLAVKENRSDIIAGVDMPSESDDVTSILIDLAQRETKNLSIGFADTLLTTLDGKTRISNKGLRSAGFRVLKAPDVPSVLLELGYISHPDDVKRLQSEKWHTKVAGAVADAVDAYFSKRTARKPF